MRIAAVVLGLLLVAGCGGSDGSSGDSSYNQSGSVNGTPGKAKTTPGTEFMPPNAEETAAKLPKCSEVWVVGEALPADYAGCQSESGGLDRGTTYTCTDGRGDLIGYNEELFARLGGPIQANGEDDAAFSQELFEVCKPQQ